MPSFNENIAKLRAASRESTRQAMEIETDTARMRGDERIRHVNTIRSKLEPFSQHLKDWKKLDIAHQEKLGRRELRKKRKEAIKTKALLTEKFKQLEDRKDRPTPVDRMPPDVATDYKAGTRKLFPDKAAKARYELWEELHGTGSLLEKEFKTIEEQHDALNTMKGKILRQIKS